VAGVRELVPADIGAELVAGILCLGGCPDRGVDLVANLLPDGLRLLETGVVSAGIQRNGNVEEDFTGLEADLGAGGIDKGRGLLDLGLDGGAGGG
jgi:hypothetical protein